MDGICRLFIMTTATGDSFSARADGAFISVLGFALSAAIPSDIRYCVFRCLPRAHLCQRSSAAGVPGVTFS